MTYETKLTWRNRLRLISELLLKHNHSDTISDLSIFKLGYVYGLKDLELETKQ